MKNAVYFAAVILSVFATIASRVAGRAAAVFTNKRKDKTMCGIYSRIVVSLAVMSIIADSHAVIVIASGSTTAGPTGSSVRFYVPGESFPTESEATQSAVDACRALIDDFLQRPRNTGLSLRQACRSTIVVPNGHYVSVYQLRREFRINSQWLQSDSGFYYGVNVDKDTAEQEASDRCDAGLRLYLGTNPNPSRRGSCHSHIRSLGDTFPVSTGGGGGGAGVGIAVGAIAVVGLAALVFSGGDADAFNWTPNYRFFYNDGLPSYSYGSRVDFRKDNISAFWGAGRAVSGGETGAWIYSGGMEYAKEFWHVQYASQVWGKNATMEFAGNVRYASGIYRWQSGINADWDAAENFSASWKNSMTADYHGWKIAPSASMQWRQGEDFGGMNFRLDLRREF